MKYLLLLLLATTAAFAQTEIIYKGETINRLDANGNKTGIWKIFDETNGITVTFAYENGERVEDTKYFKDGKLILAFDKEENLVFSKDYKIIKAYYSWGDNRSSQIVMEDGTAAPQDILDYLNPFHSVNPMYYGGIKEFTKYIVENIDHSKIKSVIGKKTTVLLTLDENGVMSVDEIKGTDDLQYIEEVKKVMSKAPRWQPGYQLGRFVNCSFSLPLTLK